MGATYTHLLGHDAVAIAKALSAKSRERKARAKAAALARAQGLTVERKEEPKQMDDPLKALKQGNRVPVEVLIHLDGEPMRFAFATNMRGTLSAPQMTQGELQARFAKMLKEAFG